MYSCSIIATWVPTNAKYWRMINSMELVRRPWRRMVASLHLHCHFWKGCHFGSFAVSNSHSCILMAPSILSSYLPAILSSILPPVPYDLSSSSSSFMKTLLLISMTKEMKKSCLVYQSICSLRATVISLFVVFHIINGTQSLKQTHCFDGLLSVLHKYRLWECERGLLT